MRFGEHASELGAHFCEGLVSGHVIELEAFPDLSVAGWAEVEWAPVRLLQVVDAHHQALVQGAVSKAKHMAKFMCGELDNSHQGLRLEIFLSLVLLIGPLWQESVDAVDTAVAISVPEAEVAQVLGEQVDICEANNSKGICVLSLDWSNEFLQDVDGVVLRVVKVILLGVDSETLDLVVGNCIEDNYFAWHVEGLHPFLKMIQVVLSDG